MMSDTLKKLLMVVSLTALIWAWAYMEIEKPLSRPGSLEVAPATDPGLLVTFSLNEGVSNQTKIPLTSLNFKGAPSQISNLLKRYNLPPNDQDKEQLNFYYDPQEHDRTESVYPLDILTYLRENNKIQELALTLESCTPPRVDVKIELLEEKKLPIQCLDENDLLIKEAVITPAFANIYVRKGYTASATVSLTQQQIDTARQQSVSVKPYVDMGIAGVIRESAEPVEVVLQSETLLKPRAFQTTKPIGIFMSPELQNSYKVTISNAEELRKTTTIYATDEAFRAYETEAYPLYIVIKDSDVINLSEIPPKTVLFNFPLEYIKSGHIRQDETKLPRSATIKIEPLNPTLMP